MFKNIVTLWKRVDSNTFLILCFFVILFSLHISESKLPAFALKAAFYFKYRAQLCAKGSKLLFFSVFISFKEKYCSLLNSYWFSKENHMVYISPLFILTLWGSEKAFLVLQLFLYLKENPHDCQRKLCFR